MLHEHSAYLTLGEAADLLRVSRFTIRRRIEQYGIQTYQGRDHREVLIRRADLERWQGIRPISPQLAGAARR